MLKLRKELVQEYAYLSGLQQLDLTQQQRLEKLLVEAKEDEILQLCFDICDEYWINTQPSEFAEEQKDSFAMLREHLGDSVFK